MAINIPGPKRYGSESVPEIPFTFRLSIEVCIPRGIPCSTSGSRLELGPPPSSPPCGPPTLDLRLRAPLPGLLLLLLPIGERSRVSGGGSRRPAGGGQEGSGAGGESWSMTDELQVEAAGVRLRASQASCSHWAGPEAGRGSK